MRLLNKFTASIAMALLITACMSTGVSGEGMVLAKLDQIEEGVAFYPHQNPLTNEPDAAVVDMEQFPEVMREAVNAFFGEEVSELVLTEERFIKEEARSGVFKLTPGAYSKEGDDSGGFGFVQQFLPLIGGAIPSSTPFLGIASYLIALIGRKRSRQHLKNMGMKLTPFDGNLDLTGAVDSGMKAIGLTHTNKTGDELMAVATQKLEEEKMDKAKAAAIAKVKEKTAA